MRNILGKVLLFFALCVGVAVAQQAGYQVVNSVVSTSCGAHNWISAIATTGSGTCGQPAAADLSNGVTGSGTVVLAASPTFTGTVTMPDASTWNSTNLSLNPAGSLANPTLDFTNCGVHCGWFAPAANQLEVSINSGKVLDYGVTVGGNWTVSGPGATQFEIVSGATNLNAVNAYVDGTNTIYSGLVGANCTAGYWYVYTNQCALGVHAGDIYMPGLASTSAAQTGTVCWSSTGGKLTVDTTLACLSSSERFKHDIVAIDDERALADIIRLEPIEFNYNDDLQISGRQIGLSAEQVASVDRMLAGFESDGVTPRGVRGGNALTAMLVGAIRAQQREIEQLKRRTH